MEDLWSANELPREGFDDGIYANEVISGLDGGELKTYSAYSLYLPCALSARLQRLLQYDIQPQRGAVTSGDYANLYE